MAPHPVEDEHATGSGWLERTDPEWALAWSHFPDPVMVHPASGECLQYMGSAQYPGRGWVHVFRHRQVPGSNQRQWIRILNAILPPPRQGDASRVFPPYPRIILHAAIDETFLCVRRATGNKEMFDSSSMTCTAVKD
jgi:hypothetical protein